MTKNERSDFISRILHVVLITVRHFIGKYLVTSLLHYLIKHRVNIIRRYSVWYVQSVLTQCIYIYNYT